MRRARKISLELPRITVQRMMIYVAVFGLALWAVIVVPPLIGMAREHWEVCNARAVFYREQAADCRVLATLHPGDAVIAPDVGYVTKKGHFIPDTGGTAAKQIPYFEALGKIYEVAKWRPWAGMPAEPPSPLEPDAD